jgi:very-short-patch-repair endonuclease
MSSGRTVWRLAKAQHGVVTHRQLRELGLSPQAIKHRITKGRLHRAWRGVYAVGRPVLTQHGAWMAAVLSCGPNAALSHSSAGALWEIWPHEDAEIEVSIPARQYSQRSGIRFHRRARLDSTYHNGIPTTTVVRTLVDLATRLTPYELEFAINEADKRAHVSPEALQPTLGDFAGQPGVAALRACLIRRAFTLTDSELERRFLSLVRSAGLPEPRTGQYVNGFKVDFYWPDLGLVVETDGWRYHRTPAQQARDRTRDQAHTVTGLTPLRFTHGQVRFEPAQVVATLTAVARRLTARRQLTCGLAESRLQN